MNRRYLLQNDEGKRYFCTLSGEEDQEVQFKKVFDLHPGCGFTADLTEKKVRIVDYFHGETRAEFEILSVKEITDEAKLCLCPAEEESK